MTSQLNAHQCREAHLLLVVNAQPGMTVLEMYYLTGIPGAHLNREVRELEVSGLVEIIPTEHSDNPGVRLTDAGRRWLQDRLSEARQRYVIRESSLA